MKYINTNTTKIENKIEGVTYFKYHPKKNIISTIILNN
jgi:hypothetical protein